MIFVAVLLGLLVALLAVPVSVAFRVEGVEPFNAQFGIGWLFGLLGFRIRLPRASRRKPPAEATVAGCTRRCTERRTTERTKRRKNGGALGVLRQAEFRGRIFRLLADLLRAAHVHELRLRMRLGLGDPADTGRLWAIVGPLSAIARNLRNADVRIEPEFVDPAFEFRADGRLLLIPLQIVALVLAFVASPASVRAWRSLKGGDA